MWDTVQSLDSRANLSHLAGPKCPAFVRLDVGMARALSKSMKTKRPVTATLREEFCNLVTRLGMYAPPTSATHVLLLHPYAEHRLAVENIGRGPMAEYVPNNNRSYRMEGAMVTGFFCEVPVVTSPLIVADTAQFIKRGKPLAG